METRGGAWRGAGAEWGELTGGLFRGPEFGPEKKAFSRSAGSGWTRANSRARPLPLSLAPSHTPSLALSLPLLPLPYPPSSPLVSPTRRPRLWERTHSHVRIGARAQTMEQSPGLDTDLGLTPSLSPATAISFPSSSSAPAMQHAQSGDMGGASAQGSSSGQPKFSNGPCVPGPLLLTCARYNVFAGTYVLVSPSSAQR